MRVVVTIFTFGLCGLVVDLVRVYPFIVEITDLSKLLLMVTAVDFVRLVSLVVNFGVNGTEVVIPLL